MELTPENFKKLAGVVSKSSIDCKANELMVKILYDTMYEVIDKYNIDESIEKSVKEKLKNVERAAINDCDFARKFPEFFP
jgi:hypothetical protein